MKLVKKIIKFFLKPLRKQWIEFDSKRKLNKTKKNIEGPILFICQCEYIWNKQRDVFVELINKGIHPILYVIKDSNSVSTLDKTIFELEFPSYIIKHENVKLKDLKPSIVIYSRPYPHHLPKDIRINNVVKYAKTAYIPYYYSLDNLVENGINDEFYKYLSIFYADQEEVKNHFEKLQNKNIRKELQHVYNFGYPMLEKLYQKEKNISIYKNNNSYKIMWTPRWTLDEKLGGSNFLKYYKDIFNNFINNKDYSMVFRPHPLLFINFIATNVITTIEKDEILSMIDNSNNSTYDTSSDYIDTFLNTDCLITDNSSIIIEYFLTGKPMIYCYNKSDLHFNRIMNMILESNYVVNNFNEMNQILEKLRNGIDEKKELRLQYVDKLKKDNFNSAKNIADNLINFSKK